MPERELTIHVDRLKLYKHRPITQEALDITEDIDKLAENPNVDIREFRGWSEEQNRINRRLIQHRGLPGKLPGGEGREETKVGWKKTQANNQSKTLRKNHQVTGQEEPL